MKRPAHGARIWGKALVALAAVACGSSTPPSTHPGPEVARTSAVGAGLPAPEPTTPVRSVWLEPPIVVGRVFFADELAPLSDAIAEALPHAARSALEVLPPEELRALQERVRAGQLPGSDARCEVVPPPMVLYSYVNAGVPSVDVRVECGDACELTLEIEEPKRTDAASGVTRDEPRRFSARLPARGTVEEWAATIRQRGLDVAPPRDEPSGGLGIISGHTLRLAKGQYRLDVDDVVTEGTWPTELDEKLLTPHARALHECKRQGGPQRDSWQQPFVIEVGQDGKMQRCEAKYRHRLDTPGFACRCDVLSRVSFGKAGGRRRASLVMRTFLGGEIETRSGHYTSVSMHLKAADPSAMFAMGSFDATRLERCLDPVGQPLEVEVPIQVLVGADGKVVDANAQWPNSLPAGVATCLSRVVADARFSCPLSGKSTVDGSMTLTVGKPR